MFDGADSPVTQTFGLGMFAPATADDLATLEAFFEERGAPVFHEVSPLADAALLELLPDRGYRPMEFTSVMYQPIPPEGLEEKPTAVTARPIAPGEGPLWADTAARGWGGEVPELGDFVRDMGKVSTSARSSHCFLAELDGTPVAAGAITIHDGVALLAGASTIPEWRGRGAQGALLAVRLRFAAEQGCDLAMMGALPGSASQRNAERQGFRIAYTRIKWQRRAAAR